MFLFDTFFYYDLDPCDGIICDGIHAVCEITVSQTGFITGKPICACAKGFTGNPKVKCGT